MKVICDEHSERATEEIGEPVVEIVSRTAGGEGLAVFVDGAEDAEKYNGEEDTREEGGFGAVFE